MDTQLVRGVGMIFARKQKERVQWIPRLVLGLPMANSDTKPLEYFGSIIGGIVLVAFMAVVVLVSIGMASFAGMTSGVIGIIGFVVVMSTIQVFGTDVLEALAEYRNGPNPSFVVEETDDGNTKVRQEAETRREDK